MPPPEPLLPLLRVVSEWDLDRVDPELGADLTPLLRVVTTGVDGEDAAGAPAPLTRVRVAASAAGAELALPGPEPAT